ncbi:MAG TPA: hypothetical protein VN326_15330, partial [Casimicrobiaceae bacterium]|nr:hypothetical protein [Casimicrobiaceae bacterium]
MTYIARGALCRARSQRDDRRLSACAGSLVAPFTYLQMVWAVGATAISRLTKFFATYAYWEGR